MSWDDLLNWMLLGTMLPLMLGLWGVLIKVVYEGFKDFQLTRAEYNARIMRTLKGE